MNHRLVVLYPIKYVDVKIKCRNYKKDSKLPDMLVILVSLFPA